ncbi:metalloregulator ArsR/SmtB family transcription factor [Amycolatopsis mongoliensis]|uniref:Metalloregulator ArsR/SmtB family transcription factor n=1 Tax=Amycolatopsis mongoliensis TaxID=715475 RepID=A0A9Y2JQ78_9PSEU|nr:metalloregulator ArsR/SmtB family transcription factor [Amycolatopsis sp. 4-36]WIY01855.1 metalloregulator ArsR/SmtB family transcription factor [Amycolatopsis sp. 4-36]
MDAIAAALGDAARWRIVELLAERPRSVGELAELTGLRQPQTTKHLQTLARAGLVTVFPLGQRRVYALEAEPLLGFAGRLADLAKATEAHEGERDVVTQYRAAVEADTEAPDRDRWADGREFGFERVLAVPRDVVWRHWTDPALLASWWVPPSTTVTACVLEPRPGGRAVLAYRDADGEYHSEGWVRLAAEPGRLAFDLAVTGEAAFTGHYDLELASVPGGTRLRLGLRVTATTAGAADALAGLETGWDQVLDHLSDVLTHQKG